MKTRKRKRFTFVSNEVWIIFVSGNCKRITILSGVDKSFKSLDSNDFSLAKKFEDKYCLCFSISFEKCFDQNPSLGRWNYCEVSHVIKYLLKYKPKNKYKCKSKMNFQKEVSYDRPSDILTSLHNSSFKSQQIKACWHLD